MMWSIVATDGSCQCRNLCLNVGMARKYVDWEEVGKEYRTGQLTLTELERRYGVSDTAILKRAKKHGWKRDLIREVRKRTDEKLVAVGTITAEAVEKAVERAAAVVQIHRADINQGRTIVRSLFQELAELNNPETREQVEASILDETANDKSRERRTQMLRAVSLPSRAGTIKALASALRDLVPLERTAFNLDPKAGESDRPDDHVPVEERVKRYNAPNIVPIRKTA